MESVYRLMYCLIPLQWKAFLMSTDHTIFPILMSVEMVMKTKYSVFTKIFWEQMITRIGLDFVTILNRILKLILIWIRVPGGIWFGLVLWQIKPNYWTGRSAPSWPSPRPWSPSPGSSTSCWAPSSDTGTWLEHSNTTSKTRKHSTLYFFFLRQVKIYFVTM